jgi:hypothetical protein
MSTLRIPFSAITDYLSRFPFPLFDELDVIDLIQSIDRKHVALIKAKKKS